MLYQMYGMNEAGALDLLWNDIIPIMERHGVKHGYVNCVPMPGVSTVSVPDGQTSSGQAIGIPGFESIDDAQSLVNDLSAAIRDTPVFIQGSSPVIAAINGKQL